MPPAVPDLKDPDLYVAAMPHDLFAQLRRDERVYWNPESDGPGFWAVLCHDDIVAVSRQPDLFSSAHANGGHRIFNENEVGLTGAGESAIGIPFISIDPPVHTQYRKLMMPAVAPGRIAGIEQRIVARTGALLDEIAMGEPVDMVQALSAPLPLMTLCELLDLPPEVDWRDLYTWTNAFVGEDDPEFRQSPEAMGQILGGFFALMQQLFEQRRHGSGQDVVTLLASADVNGEPTQFRDFIGNMILTLVGANETTRNSLSHTMVNFAANPAQWDLVRADPGVLRHAVREMVRHASPVIHMRRTATADTVLGGKAIAKGDKVVMWYASGNRDESVFERPDAFDITRGNIQHLGFGHGQHVCVGSRLAEMQLRVAFTLLAERVKGFELLAQPRRFRSNFINGLKTLEMILHPA
jgi:linalool 8-monooxygenase